MKKYLLLFLMCVYASIGALATPVTFGAGNSTYENNGDGSYTITVKEAADLSYFGWDNWPWKNATRINLQLDGITMQSLCSVNQLYNLTQNTSVTTIDFTNLNTTDLDYLKNNWGTVPDNFKSYFSNLIVPSFYASDFVTTEKNVFSVSSTTLNAYIANVNNVNWSDVKGSCTTLSPYNFSGGDLSGCSFSTIDFTNTTITASTTVPDASTVYVNTTAEKALITGTDASNVKVPFLGTATVAAGGSLESNITTLLNSYDLHNTLADITTLTVTGELTSADVTWLNTNKSNLTGLTTLDLTGATFGAGVTKASVADAVRTGVTVLYPASYTITDGCTVTIDMSKAMGDNLATILAAAKTALGSTNICTLIVTGELTANDLIALGGTNMTGATRIDLSGATLASGVNLDYLQVPSSLESLVLPKDQTVSVGLASKLAAATDLEYAYSPSSSEQNDNQAIADYIWVNKAGGLKTAASAEAAIRTAVYVKIESKVALNDDDAKFGSMGISATTETNYPWQYIDMSGAVVTAEATLAATKPHDKGYRIILPDNLTGDQMSIFASNSNKGSVAALYSYTGTTLRILELTDNTYKENALRDHRIVFPGTDAIEIVSGTYNGTRYGLFGDFNSDTNNNLLRAINGADENIKTVILNGVWATTTDLAFSNTHIETLQIDGIHKHYNPSQGSNIIVTGCTSLKTLNITNSVINSLNANGITSLTTVNLNGTTNIGATNLSSTGLATFTTNSSTKLQGDINLKSTALTSLNTTAEIGTTTGGTGNILLNGCESLASITLGSAQFKNGTSMIHIDKSTTEVTSNTDAIDLLSKTETVGESQVAVKTIFVPNGFASSSRIHPYAEVQHNVSEVAGSNANEDGDGCTITYDATTKVATVHTTAAGHFAKMMETRYANYPQGATFKFDATSVINEADLQALAGTINSYDYSWRTNYYYVDLYDLTATDALCNNTTGVIGNTITWLRTNNRQFKGLILPKDHTLYGSGISLIQSENPKHEGELSTCSEFIAYFKTKDMVNNVETNLPTKILFTHVYNQTATNSEGIQASNDKLTELLTAHGLNGAAENCPVDLYSVSTNGVVPFDATTLVGDKGYVETFNNEMVGPDTRANIYAYPSVAGEFTTFVDYSSIGVTTTEVLKIDGTVSSDASAVAASINRFTNGPRVLDLKGIKPNSDEFLSALLPALTNSNIEYIILPAGKSKELVCNTTYSTSLTNLKAVISSSNTDLVAYVKQAGSLAEARYLATGGSVTGDIFTPTQTGLQSVTLAGSLNAGDIAANTTTNKVNADGHWGSGSGNATSIALSSEQGTITTIDLKDAVFATQTDMNFSYAGLGSIQNITLPTDEHMTLIPAECFYGITSFTDLCIPYNYTHIDNAALNGTYLEHLTTTDSKGALVDNGPKTYTFSKNLEEIGSEPDAADANGVHILSETVFPQNRGVTDVYVLAHKVPKCYANAFPANMLYGWGGFKGGDFPYCREKYDNSSDGSMIFTVLHFPDKASFNASSDKEDSYEKMKRYYTDVNKVYTKKEQTGAVDANGDPIAWPTFAELRRAYNQATAGAQWYDWNIDYDGQGSINGGNYIPVGTGEYTVVPTGTDPNTSDVDYDFSSYEGWHQFSLSMATYVEPDKNIVNDVVKNEYVEGAWYTLCIPFSLTEEQLIKMLGIPKSVDNVEENYLDGVKVTTPMLPDLRTLRSVTRTPGTQNKVTLLFTNNLTMTRPGSYEYWNINDAAPNLSDYGGCGALTGGSKIAIKGGFPYLVKPYLPKDEVVKNLGKYIITHFGDQFTSEQSCMNSDYCYEDLATYSETNKTGRFAKPFERHKIQAYLDYKDNTKNAYTKHADGTNYYYTFVGQFWTQPLPRYSFYMVENNNNTAGKWYLYSSGNKDYKWNAYKCIILVTQENDDTSAHPNSGKYRNNETGHSVYPVSSGTDAQGAYIFDKPLYIEFLDGRDDTDFADVYNGGGSAKYIFSFDDIIQELDENGNETTSIDSLDGVEINTLPDNYKVYNMSGQYVGNSINGLGKGLYIVNGKKIVVQ